MCEILPRYVSKTATRLQMMEKPPLVWERFLLEWRCFVRNAIVVVAHVRDAATHLGCCRDEWRKDVRSLVATVIGVRRAAMYLQLRYERAIAPPVGTAGAGWRCQGYPINARIASSCRCAACLPWIYRSRSLDASRSTCLTVTGFAGAMTSARPWRSYSQMCSRCSL